MKPLMLSAFCFLSICAFAQHPLKTNPYQFHLPDTLKKFKGSDTEAFQQLLHDYFQKKYSQNNLVENRHGNIAMLPQDHMPCIVPNTSGIAAIPNAWKNIDIPYVENYHPIPNPALPKVQPFKHDLSLQSSPQTR